ncbi:MAG: OmpH family outer membrane protein, partial [Pyrinomonadaceae bacterium]|nr:OmpH family outer membrane protein [Pyrinomonadaceae bacterium]
ATSRYNRRLTTATSPISQAIGNALNEFGKQKGYAIIFDLSADEKGLIVAIPNEKIDITKDFIAFYNAKP